jgi:hypothetical protein
MSKDYWHSAGTGALGLSGPWNSTARWKAHKDRPSLRRIALGVQFSLMTASLAGAIIAGYINWQRDARGPRDIADFAYLAIGRSIEGLFTSILRLVDLGDYAASIQDNFLFYLEIPYQVCAFAGAYAATEAIQYLDHVLAMVPTQF